MKLRRYTCRAVRNLLPLHVGGDLDPQDAEPVDEHLHACLTCFREFRELLTLRGRLGVLADQPLPAGILDGFADEVMARIEVGEPGPRAELPGRPAPLRQITRYAAAASLLLALGLGLSSLSDIRSSSQARPTGHEPVATVAPTVLRNQPAPSRVVSTHPSLPSAAVPSEEQWMGASGSAYERRPLTPVGLPSPMLEENLRSWIEGHAGSDALPAWGHGLVPERGRRLRLREP